MKVSPKAARAMLHPMDHDLRLDYAPDNASLCLRLALETFGRPYETVLVNRQLTAQNSAAYLALLRNGLIPTLETPDVVMFETRPAAVRAAQAEGLGPTPFSNPGLPNPPEGSAL